MKSFTVSTRAQASLTDITPQVAQIIAESGVREGLAVVFVAHTTAGITINENADPDVRRDILDQLDRMVPDDDRYAHTEGNSPGHIKASLVGFSVTLIVSSAKPVLGTWQGVYLCDFDGPRARTVHVKVIPS